MKACYLLDSHFQATSVNDVAYGCNRGGICPWIQVCTLMIWWSILKLSVHDKFKVWFFWAGSQMNQQFVWGVETCLFLTTVGKGFTNPRNLSTRGSRLDLFLQSDNLPLNQEVSLYLRWRTEAFCMRCETASKYQEEEKVDLQLL